VFRFIKNGTPFDPHTRNGYFPCVTFEKLWTRIKRPKKRSSSCDFFLTTISLGLFSLSALAAPGAWISISNTSASANTQLEFMELQQKFPLYFANVDPTQVKSALIAAHDFLYEGDSTCPAGDLPELGKGPFNAFEQ
jgi:hypothetical protein